MTRIRAIRFLWRNPEEICGEPALEGSGLYKHYQDFSGALQRATRAKKMAVSGSTFLNVSWIWVSCFQKDTLTGCRQSNCLISSFGGIDKISHSFKMLQDASRCFKMLQVIFHPGIIRSKLPKIQPSLKDQASVPLLKLTDMDSQIEVFWKKFGLESSERFGHW